MRNLRWPAVLAALLTAVSAAAEELPGVRASGIPPEKPSSAIDRPEFKIRNLPYYLPEDPSAPGAAGGVPSELFDMGVPQPSQEDILSTVPEPLILKYIDHVDFEQHLTTEQQAEKYLMFSPGDEAEGAPMTAPPDTNQLALQWLMKSDKQQRDMKLAWFRSVQSSVSMDDVSRVVDLRTYRVMSALNTIAAPSLRDVQPAIRVTYTEIEKLKMPALKPLSDWGRNPNPEFSSPKIRPIRVEPSAEGPVLIPSPIVESIYESGRPAAPAPDGAPEGAPDGASASPTLFGIPSSLRNGP